MLFLKTPITVIKKNKKYNKIFLFLSSIKKLTIKVIRNTENTIIQKNIFKIYPLSIIFAINLHTCSQARPFSNEPKSL